MEKKKLLNELGLDHLIIAPFTKEFAEQTASEYVEDFLIEKNDELKNIIRLGGQVDVVVYTGDSVILNSIASFRIKLNALLSYAR